MRTGQVDFAVLSLGLGFRASLLGGENLSLLQQSYVDQLKLAVSGMHCFAAVISDYQSCLLALPFANLLSDALLLVLITSSTSTADSWHLIWHGMGPFYQH